MLFGLFPIYSASVFIFSNPLDLVKLFGSRSRVKLLEKLVIEDTVGRSSTGFFIRELCRDTDEQINAVRRELMNLEALGILKSYEQNKKKYYAMNRTSLIYNDIREMFLKSYNVLGPVKDFFKGRKNLDLVTISESILDFRNETTNNIVDIFIIGEEISFFVIVSRSKQVSKVNSVLWRCLQNKSLPIKLNHIWIKPLQILKGFFRLNNKWHRASLLDRLSLFHRRGVYFYSF